MADAITENGAWHRASVIDTVVSFNDIDTALRSAWKAATSSGKIILEIDWSPTSMMFKLKLLLFRWTRKLGAVQLLALGAGRLSAACPAAPFFPAESSDKLFGESSPRCIGPLTPRPGIATDNLRQAYPEKSDAEIEIAREMWDSMARLFAEYIFLDAIFDFDPYATTPGLVEVEGIVFERLRDEKKPHIFFTAHTGNFELLPICAATFGLNVTALFRRQPILYRQQGSERPVAPIWAIWCRRKPGLRGRLRISSMKAAMSVCWWTRNSAAVYLPPSSIVR